MTCVQSSATSVMASTPNVQIVHIHYTGASIPSDPMKYYSPYFGKKHVTKILGKLFLFVRQISYDLYFSHSPHYAVNLLLDAIHLWRPHGEGHAQVDACGRGRGSSPMWTSTQKIKIRIHWRHPVFFSCKEFAWRLFNPNFVFGRNNKWKFFGDIN